MYKKLAKLILCLIVTSSVLYSGGFQLNEHGARSMSQGGAFAARANDPSAIYFNPAGLAHLDGTRLMLGATVIFPNIAFTPHYSNPFANNTEEIDAESLVFTPINLYFTHQLNDMFTVGLGVFNPYGLGTEWNSDWIGRALSVKAEIQLFNFNPTVAAKFFNDKLSVAAGFNFVMGSVEMLREAVPAPPAPVPATLHLKAGLTDGTGYGYNFGIQYKPTPSLNFGFSYRSAVDVKVEGDATFTPPSLIDALGLPEGKVKSTLNLPANIFIGAACSPIDNLWLEFNAQFIGWSAFDKLEMEFQKNNSVTTLNEHYKDTWIFRLGAEYTLSDALALSCGVFRDLNPTPDETLGPMLPDSDRWGINLGASYKISKNISIDLAYMFLLFDERRTTEQEHHFNGTYNTLTHLGGININFEF